jgi:uncharacterized protein (TIGR02266 family)
VRIVFANGTTVDGRTEDISDGGILVVTDAECTANQKVQVRLPLPGGGTVVTLDAVVRWARSARGRRAIGLEFVDAPETAHATIRRYVEIMTAERERGATPT